MKSRMMMDEMAEAFSFYHPEYFPTKQMVGRWARTVGYRLHKQKFSGKQVYFYIKDNISND